MSDNPPPEAPPDNNAPSNGPGNETDNGQQQKGNFAAVQQVRALLRAKDDTSRFVGLALLKSVLDNSPDLRSDEAAVTALWDAIPPKFLERLLRTGARQAQAQPQPPPDASDAPDAAPSKPSSDMLDLAVSVLHTFAALLPDAAKQSPKLLDRISQLTACLLHSSKETARLILETLVSLVSQPDGARMFVKVQDLSPLTEMAPSQPLVLDALMHAWLGAMTAGTDKASLASKMDSTISSLCASFTGTDAVTLLSFLADLIPRLEPELLPSNPSWLPSVTKFIRNLVASRPTSAGRTAFTNLSVALLETYPSQTPKLLFSSQTAPSKPSSSSSDNPSSYLLINLTLIDLRASLPTLLTLLNTPDYPPLARRLSSAFNILSHFIGYLLRSMEGDDPSSHADEWFLSPDLLLKLRKSISETLSLTTEFLRDRWDASVAGAMGLHPDAREGPAHTERGSHYTVVWDSILLPAARDPLVLAAVRALALWVREDDNDTLRKETAGLVDMFVEVYRDGCELAATTSSTAKKEGGLDFRRAVLVAFEGLLVDKKGRNAILDNSGWEVLSSDLFNILESWCSPTSATTEIDESDAARGIEIVRVLLALAEAERPGPREAWMDVVTKVAALYVPPELLRGPNASPVVAECLVAALQLVTALLAGAHPGMRKRYVHSTTAVLGIAHQIRKAGNVVLDAAMGEALADVMETLGGLR
ncbi:hypothetical protein VTJ04DRAFT_436 [Mycothermus thermophilus]|uniref:uncharacterized protein n=1 Tax=Humicola insolens TaxID=85995 RepID=UPI003742CE4B